MDLEEAARPAVLGIRGERVALLAFTDNEPRDRLVPTVAEAAELLALALGRDVPDLI
jgi:hypothetical protein